MAKPLNDRGYVEVVWALATASVIGLAIYFGSKVHVELRTPMGIDFKLQHESKQ
jgi:hypothetical protein